MAAAWSPASEDGNAAPEDTTRGGLQRIAELFLAEQELRATKAIYGWCSRAERVCYGACAGDWAQRRQARLALKAMQQELQAMRGGAAPASREDIELQRTFQEYPSMQEEPFVEMLTGMQQWLDGNPLYPCRYQSFDDLRSYAHALTGTVGLMLLPLICGAGEVDPKLASQAAELGVAVNLVNCLQVVGVDMQAGYLYLPLDEVGRFGVKEGDVRELRATAEYRELIRFQVDRLRGMLSSAQAAAGRLQGRGRLGVLAIVHYSSAVLDEVVARGCDNLTEPVRVSSARKAGVLGSALWSWARLGLGGRA